MGVYNERSPSGSDLENFFAFTLKQPYLKVLVSRLH